MTCCMAGKYGNWCSSEPKQVITSDGVRKIYCIFHAPTKNRFEADINQRALDLLRDASESNSACNLKGTIFSERIELDIFDRNLPFPETDFSECTFNHLIFDDVICEHDLTFEKAIINKFDLTKSEFRGNINLKESIIGKMLLFNVKFHSALFNKAEIDYAFFRDALFETAAEFTDSKLNRILFRGKTFSDADRSQHFFTDVSVLNYLRFENVCMKNVSLLYADVTRMEFIKCDWDRIGSRRIIFDENHPDISPHHSEDVKRDHFRKVQDIYNRLKQKYKNEHNDGEASNWHWCEKEMWLRTSTWDDWHIPINFNQNFNQS